MTSLSSPRASRKYWERQTTISSFLLLNDNVKQGRIQDEGKEGAEDTAREARRENFAN